VASPLAQRVVSSFKTTKKAACPSSSSISSTFPHALILRFPFRHFLVQNRVGNPQTGTSTKQPNRVLVLGPALKRKELASSLRTPASARAYLALEAKQASIKKAATAPDHVFAYFCGVYFQLFTLLSRELNAKLFIC
jgi:hypothetical protein